MDAVGWSVSYRLTVSSLVEPQLNPSLFLIEFNFSAQEEDANPVVLECII